MSPINQLTNAIASRKDSEVKSLLVDQKVDARKADSLGRVPLEVAVSARSLSSLKLLDEYGDVDFMIKIGNEQKRSLLHLAAENSYGETDICEYLIDEQGLYVDERDTEGITPVFIAASKGFTNVVRFFAQRAANFQRTSADGTNIYRYVIRDLYPETSTLVHQLSKHPAQAEALHELPWFDQLSKSLGIAQSIAATDALLKNNICKRQFMTFANLVDDDDESNNNNKLLPFELNDCPLNVKLGLAELLRKYRKTKTQEKEQEKQEKFRWLFDLAAENEVDIPDELLGVVAKNGIGTRVKFFKFFDRITSPQHQMSQVVFNSLLNDAPANAKIALWTIIETMKRGKQQSSVQWIFELGKKYNIEIPLALPDVLIKNEISRDLLPLLNEGDCRALDSSSLKCKLTLWNLVKSESGISSELEKLRSQNIILQNHLEEKEAELREKNAELMKIRKL